MWSLGKTIEGLANGHHFPVGFQANRGIRSLFPVTQRGRISIHLLQNYLYSQTGRVVLEAIAANLYVGADGAGNWALWGNISIGTEPGGEECKWEAGFVFEFSTDSMGHGFVAVGNDFDPNAGHGRPVQLNFAVQGVDAWLRGNWPDVFAKNVFLYLADATGFNSLPDTSNAATKYGFSGLTMLVGASPMVTSYTDTTGSVPPTPSGPGGVDWNIPPTNGGDDGDG